MQGTGKEGLKPLCVLDDWDDDSDDDDGDDNDNDGNNVLPLFF